MKFFILILSLLLTFRSHAGTGAIPSGQNIKMLKDNIRFKTTNTRIMSGDSDDPTVVAKSADEGSIYIQDGTGDLYVKRDTGSTLNWLSLILGTGTDNNIARWDGSTGIQDSLVSIDDAGVVSGSTQINVDNLTLDGNTLSSTDVAGNLLLDTNGGLVEVVDDLTVQGDFTVNGTTTTINSTTLTVADQQVTVNSGGTQASADLNDAGIEVDMSDATNSGLYYNSAFTSLFGVGEFNDFREIVTVSDIQAITAKSLLEVDNLRLDANTLSSLDVNGNIILDPNGVGNVQLPDLTVSQPAYIDASGNLVSQDISLSSDVSGILSPANGGTGVDGSSAANGTVLIGNGSGYTLTGITGTANQVSVTNGAGSITLATPQDIATTSSVQFGQLDIDNLRLDANTISSTAGDIVLDPTGDLNLPDLTVSQPAYIDASGNLVSQDLSLTADVSGVLPIANGGTNSSTALNSDRVMLSSGGSIVESGVLTDGQLIIGSTGLSPVVANIAGTANQVSVTNGAGSITLATPQDIATTSSVTFAQLNVDNLRLDGNTISSTDVNGMIVLNANGTGTTMFEDVIQMDQKSTCPTPSASDLTLCAKTDDNLYIKDSAGDEYILNKGVGTEFILLTGDGHGSTDTKIRKFGSYACGISDTATAIGASQSCGEITCTNNATEGAACTVNEDGVYAIYYQDQENASDISIGISVNSSNRTTNIESINDPTERIAIQQENGGAYWTSVSRTVKLTNGDVVRAHGTGTETGTTGVTFIITRVK
jgi:hypothetical protein